MDDYGFNIKLHPTQNIPSEESIVGWSVDNSHASQHSPSDSRQEVYSPDENSSLILTASASNPSPATIGNPDDYFRIEEEESSPQFSYVRESKQEVSLRKVQGIEPKQIVINTTKQYLKQP